MEPPARYVLAVVRVHRRHPGCSADTRADVLHRDEVAYFCGDATAEGNGSGGDGVTVSRADMLLCGRLLVASLPSSTGAAGVSDYAHSSGWRDALNDHDGDEEEEADEEEEEEELFNREMDATVFRRPSVEATPGSSFSSSGQTDAIKTGHTSTQSEADEDGVLFHLPRSHTASQSMLGVGIPEVSHRRAFYMQQAVRVLVLLSNVPFQSYLREKLLVLASEVFTDAEMEPTTIAACGGGGDESACATNYDAVATFYQRLHTTWSADALPYRVLFTGLPIINVVRRLGRDVIAILRVLLLEGRVVCYSANPARASSATMALLALLPGALTTQAEVTSRLLQAVVYRLRRSGMPFSLFTEQFVHQPCFTSDQENEIYSTQGFLVGTSDPLLLKRPRAQLDMIVDLDSDDLVTFPTAKTELAFGFGASTAAFADSLAEKFGRNLTEQTAAFWTSMVGSTMNSRHADAEWVVGQFQTYFEHFLEQVYNGLFRADSVSKAKSLSTLAASKFKFDPYHSSVLSRFVEEVAAPMMMMGDHAAFYAEYGHGWTHAWLQTSNFDSWRGAHRMERRRSSVVDTISPPNEGHAEYTYPTGDTYEGEFQHGKRHGFGIYVEYVTKNQYEGEWVEDQRHGKGILSSKVNGYIYDGEWKHDLRCGRGHSSLTNVENYAGEWLDNHFHGMGVYSNVNGDIYDGEWRRGVKDGIGKLTIARSRPGDPFGGVKQYVGEWSKGKFHGMGTLQYVDGTQYAGGFQDGKRHGSGLLLFPNGDRYDGEWWKGFQHGEGSMFSAKSGITREGTWKKDAAIDGTWFLTYTNGDKYTGECRRGRPWGEGIFKYADGSSFSGTWVDGMREGLGIRVNVDGTILEGEWKNDAFVKAVRRPSTFVDIPLSHSPQSLPPPARPLSPRSHGNVVYYDPQKPLCDGTHAVTYRNGDTYDGNFKSHRRHGFGVFTERATGNVYEGQWRDDLRHGTGVLTSGMKDFIYDGNWDHDVRSGYGHCVIRGCETYSGYWSENQFEGTGKFIDAEGNAYEGEFVCGKKQGVGKQVSASEKEQYSGEWKNGQRDGIGDAAFADGATYSGGWKNDAREGEGTFISAKGERYVGQWRNGQRDGAGVSYNPTTRVSKEGIWVADEAIDGDWTIQFPDGSKFTGECVNERPHGRGVCKYANGDLYDGQWVNGKRHGIGSGFFANGESFTGEWENNHVALNGKGELTLANGTVHVYTR